MLHVHLVNIFVPTRLSFSDIARRRAPLRSRNPCARFWPMACCSSARWRADRQRGAVAVEARLDAEGCGWTAPSTIMSSLAPDVAGLTDLF